MHERVNIPGVPKASRARLKLELQRDSRSCTQSKSSTNFAPTKTKISLCDQMNVLSQWSMRTVIARAHNNISLTRSIHATSSKLKVAKAGAEKPDPPISPSEKLEPATVGPLDRPLGVRQRPTTVVQTRTERVKELLDADARMDQRRHLYVA